MTSINESQASLLEAFKSDLLNEDTSQHTISAYLSDITHFMKWYMEAFQEFDLDEVTPTDIREYREYLQEQVPPMAPATINRRLAALRRFFRWANVQQLSTSEPTKRIRNVESTEPGPKSLDRKQWNRLLRKVEQAKGKQGIRDRCIVVLLYHSGLRAGELAALLLSDITLAERSGSLNIRRGKGNKARRVPLNAEARAVIREYL